MKKRIMFILALGVSFAPAAFGAAMPKVELSHTGEGSPNPLAAHCAVEAGAEKAEIEYGVRGEAQTQGGRTSTARVDTP